jgi:hypothetical protein
VFIAGPFHGSVTFLGWREQGGFISAKMLLNSSKESTFPQIPDEKAGEIFDVMRSHPRLDTGINGVKFISVAEFHATSDRKHFDAGAKKDGLWRVYGGDSFNIWEPDTGKTFAWADPKIAKKALQDRRKRQIKLKSSAFFGMSEQWAADENTLPCCFTRIAYRAVTNSTNTRTLLTSLVPPNVFLVNMAPYLFRKGGTEKDEAFLLGILSSLPLDWYIRRFVEMSVNFHVFNSLPIPSPSQKEKVYGQIVEISARLTANTKDFDNWAKAVGVAVGSVKSDEQRNDMEAELDALVAHLYGLTREQVEHIFKTFHRGWDYGPRLEKTLEHFDRIESEGS